MATTRGSIQRLQWTGNIVCVWIGPHPASVEALFIVFSVADDAATLSGKRRMANLLARAEMAGDPVACAHGDSDAAITEVAFEGYDICVQRPIHGDFFVVSGSGLPADTRVVFDGPVATVTVTPDLVRPNWALVSALPAGVPVGRQTVHLESPGSGWSSESVPVEVGAGPLSFVRWLYTGAPKANPYTIVLVANPGRRTSAGALVADPMVGDPARFATAVATSLTTMFTVTETVLQAFERSVALAIVRDATVAITDSVSLVQEDSTNIVSPRRDLMNGYLRGYRLAADVVYAISGSPDHTRSSAWFTTDDATRAGVSFTYNGTAFSHGRFASIPGSIALGTPVDPTGLTALHEFGHASSDFNNGKIDDLYVDGLRSGLEVNKKARANATDPIPAQFATYNGTAHNSDQNRDGLGYPATWTSYHCALLDATRPNMMDNYWLTANPLQCRLDEVTFAWLSDRLAAKVGR